VEPQDPEGHRESTLLKLCCDKALNLLGWHSVLSLPETVRLTAAWYRTYYEPGDGQVRELTSQQIEEYVSRAKAQGLAWAG
jgi:CDP-glucose 4,6-dehydratase